MSEDLISIIIPIHNGSNWIDRCFNSILQQTALKIVKTEICICNDYSTDDTIELLNNWQGRFEKLGVFMKIYNNICGEPLGVGYAKNKAVSISSGNYLCFQDVDDIMLPDRILKQYEKAKCSSDDMLIGSNYKREPENSTVRYTKWANSLSEVQLTVQIFTAFGPTIIMPTWFCHRKVFDKVEGFAENRFGCPEDLIFFYKHLDMGGKVYKVDEILLIYTYHMNAATFSVKEQTIWNLRVERLQKLILQKWQSFTIWNAGKQGRKLYNCLSTENQNKVVALCDVDQNKIGKMYEPFDSLTRKTGRLVKIISYIEAKPPFVICVKLDLTNGNFENILKTLNLEEGQDYILFS